MKFSITTAKRFVVGVVAVGALSLGSAGIAGADSTTPTTAAPTTAPATSFNCANATKALDRIQSVEAKITAGLPKLTAREAKLTQAGHTALAARLQKRITRLESSTFKAHLDKASTAIETKCNVPAPAAPQS